MITTLGHSQHYNYFPSFTSRPAKCRSQLFWSGTTLLLSLLAFGSSAFAQASLTPATLSFGNQGLNNPSAAKKATLKNEQTGPITISSIAISGGTAPADYAWGGTCPISPNTLGAGLSCSITATFTPSALGSRTATLTVTDTATNSPQTVSLTGTGVKPATTSPPTTLAFGDQEINTTSAAKTVKLTNNDSTAITLSGNTLTGVSASAFAISSTTCGTSLGAHASCNISITFAPGALVGAASATLSIADSASNSPQTVSLTGTGEEPVTLSVSTLSFGTVLVGLTSSAKSVTLTNHQSVSLTFSSIVTYTPFAISSNTCGTGIAAGATCSVGVTFSPTATGAPTGELTFTDNAANDTIQNVNLTGTGGAPVTVSPASLKFSSTTVGTTSAAQTVVLKNVLPTSVTLSTPVASAGFAVASNTCPASLAPGLTCTVGVNFTPTEVGSYKNADLQIPYSAPGSPAWVALSGTGNATGLVSITVTPANPAILVRQTQQFTATGYFKSGSPQNLTDSVTWSSSVPNVATIDSFGSVRGLASAGEAGTTTIKAALGAIKGSTTLNVTSFIYTGSLNTARQGHTATLLNNGMVLIAGGTSWDYVTNSSVCLASAELYDPATGTFSPTGSLNTAREAHTATLLNNGMVLIAGGYNSSSGDLASAELYNPATGMFSYTTGSLNTAREQHTATLLNNGLVLMAGGLLNDDFVFGAELYNPSTETFAHTGYLNNQRLWHTATLLNDGMVLIAGGYLGSGDYLGTAELYNPATGSFAFTGSLNTARGSDTATLLNNGMVLMAGGWSNSGVLATAELYNPSTGTFSPTGSLNTGRDLHTATLLNNGKVLIAGGWYTILASAELYDPASETFSYTTGSLNTAREQHTATLLDNGLVLIAGGFGSSVYPAPPLASAELYGPATLTPLDLESIAVTPATSTLSPGTTQQFIATGSFSDSSTQQLASVTWTSSNTTLAQISNDATNPGMSLAIPPGPTTTTAVTITATAGSVSGTATLTVRPTGFVYTGSLNTGRFYHTATLLNNGMVLIAGGYSPSLPHILASAELYNPATGTFTPTGSLKTARYYHTATLLDNGMVLIAGGQGSSGYLTRAELYNPATGTFTYTTGSMKVPRVYHTATVLDNGLVLMAGGANGLSGSLVSAELYNPATETFSYTTGSMNADHNCHTATLLDNGMVLIAGGYSSENYSASGELYNPATETFSYTAGSLKAARVNHTATLLNNGMVLMAGGRTPAVA